MIATWNCLDIFKLITKPPCHLHTPPNKPGNIMFVDDFQQQYNKLSCSDAVNTITTGDVWLHVYTLCVQ